MEQLGRRAEGFPVRPLGFYIFVADFGQPDRSEGGIYYGDSTTQFGRYRMSEWRHGEVIAMGPGMILPDGRRAPMPSIEIGDVVMFSRKHGTRLPGELRYRHPRYTGDHPAAQGLLIRVLDPWKCQAACDGFVPWWDAQAAQMDPSKTMSG